MTFLKKEEGSPCCWASRGGPKSVWSIGASRGDARGGDRWRGAARSVLAGGDGRTRSRGACSRRCRARGDGSSNERRRGSLTTTSGRRRQQRLGGSCRVAGKGALSDGVSLGWCERRRCSPGDWCCALCVHSSALASARDRHWDGRAIPATAIAPSWNAVERRREWYLRMARRGPWCWSALVRCEGV